MQVLWFIPSLIFGSIMAITTGSWLMVAFAGSTLAIMPLLTWQRHRKAVDLKADIEILEDEIYIGSYRLPQSGMLWRQEWHDLLFQKISAEITAKTLQQNLVTGIREQQSRSGDFILGRHDSGPVELSLSNEAAHLLIVGATGSGKSQLLIAMLNSHLTLKGPSVADFYLLDFKGGATLRQFANHPRALKFATDLGSVESNSIWSVIYRELEAREELFAEHLVSRIEDFPPLAIRPNRLFIVVDELAAALASNSIALGALSAVLSRGRSLGMHLIATSQSSQGLPRSALINFGARIYVGGVDQIEAAQLGIRAQNKFFAEPALSASLHLRDRPAVNFAFINATLARGIALLND